MHIKVRKNFFMFFDALSPKRDFVLVTDDFLPFWRYLKHPFGLTFLHLMGKMVRIYTLNNAKMVKNRLKLKQYHFWTQCIEKP